MNAAALEQDYEILSELDFIFAKANLAKSYHGVAPEFNTEGHIDVYKRQAEYLFGYQFPVWQF